VRKLIEYKTKWIFKNSHAVRVYSPVYIDIGKGSGLEKPKDKRSVTLATGDGNCIIRI
jgi:hypothetical protein